MLASVLFLIASGCGGGQRATLKANVTPASLVNPKQEEEAIAEIQRRGGAVQVDEKSPSGPAITVSLMGPRFGDADVPLLAGFKRLDVLGLKASRVTDQGLAELAELPSKDCIRVLILIGTRVTDGGLVHIREFRNLETLNLEAARIGDAGLKHLSALKTLRNLDISGTRVTDAGLRNLQAMGHLEHLYVLGAGRLTDAGLKDLQHSLPKLRLHRYPRLSK